MKSFEYVWELNGQKLSGTKRAENEEALRTHIRQLGGELVSVTSSKEIESAETTSEISSPASPRAFAGPVQESEEDIQRELKKWNGGAFLLSWIWGIGNNTWIALLALLPMVQIPMMIVLGIKGNDWAWKNNPGQTLSQFRESQKRWARWGMAAAAFMAPALLGMFILFSSVIKKSEPYQISLAVAKNDPEIQRTLGTPMKEGFFVWGKSAYSGGEKKVNLAYTLEGSKDHATVYVNAVKKAGHWDYHWIYVDLGKERRRVNKTPGSLIQDRAAKKTLQYAGVSKTEALKIAARVCAEKGWMAGFDDVEITEDTVNGVWHVKTNAGVYGNNAYIDIDQKTGAVVKTEKGVL